MIYIYLVLNGIENEISLFPLLKQSALFLQIARIRLMFIIHHQASRPVYVITARIRSVVVVIRCTWRDIDVNVHRISAVILLFYLLLLLLQRLTHQMMVMMMVIMRGIVTFHYCLVIVDVAI